VVRGFSGEGMMDIEAMATELVQVMAVCAAWLEAE